MSIKTDYWLVRQKEWAGGKRNKLKEVCDVGILDLINKTRGMQGKVVCEFGCGTGQYLSCVKKYGRLYGIDFMEDCVAVADKIKPPRCEIVLDDIVSLKFNREIDIAYTVTCLQHIHPTQIEKAIKNIVSLKPSDIYLYEVTDDSFENVNSEDESNYMWGHNYTDILRSFGYDLVTYRLAGNKKNYNMRFSYRPNVVISWSAKHFAKYLALHIDASYVDIDCKHRNIIDTRLVKGKNVMIVGFYCPRLWDNPGHYKEIIENSRACIIYFVGTDVEQLINPRASYSIQEKHPLRNFFNRNAGKISFISENKYQADVVGSNYKIDVSIVPMPVKDVQMLNAGLNFPKDRLHVGVYAPPFRELYNFNVIMDVIRQSPNYRFYLYSNGGFKRKPGDVFPPNVVLFEKETPISIIYNKINCGIRMTNNDGEPQTGVELMMLGKYFIYNHPMRHCNYVPLNRNVVRNIVSELAKISKNLVFSESVRNYYMKRHCPTAFKATITKLFR